MFTRGEALRRVEGATPDELFGGDWTRRAEARRLYWKLIAVLHPDRTGADDVRAREATIRLNRLYQEWQRDPVVRTARGEYRLGPLHAVGSIANVYQGDGVVVKLVRNPALNPLLHAEWHALRALKAFTDKHRWLRPYYPRLVDVGDVGRGERAFTVLKPLVDGFVTLADVKTAYPQGLDGRDWAWMHRRLLRALAGAHQVGLVHGGVCAENVLVHPRQHGIVLVGWSFAVQDGQRLLASSKSIAYPPEGGGQVTAALDIHMAHALMLDMVAHNETRQRAFAKGCMQDAPALRPEAVDLLTEYDELLEELYGRRAFRPFALPETTKAGA